MFESRQIRQHNLSTLFAGLKKRIIYLPITPTFLFYSVPQPSTVSSTITMCQQSMIRLHKDKQFYPSVATDQQCITHPHFYPERKDPSPTPLSSSYHSRPFCIAFLPIHHPNSSSIDYFEKCSCFSIWLFFAPPPFTGIPTTTTVLVSPAALLFIFNNITIRKDNYPPSQLQCYHTISAFLHVISPSHHQKLSHQKRRPKTKQNPLTPTKQGHGDIKGRCWILVLS